MCNCGDLKTFYQLIFFFFFSVWLQLQERIQDLEKERDLLKENCDKLVKRCEDNLNYVHNNTYN